MGIYIKLPRHSFKRLYRSLTLALWHLHYLRARHKRDKTYWGLLVFQLSVEGCRTPFIVLVDSRHLNSIACKMVPDQYMKDYPNKGNPFILHNLKWLYHIPITLTLLKFRVTRFTPLLFLFLVEGLSAS